MELDLMVNSLVETSDKETIITRLQDINHYLLSSRITINDDVYIEPKWVEAYYYNCKKCFCDTYSHKKDGQKNRPYKLYFHEVGRGGVDLCLSKGDYYLSFLLKWTDINGNFKGTYKQIELFEQLINKYNNYEYDLKVEKKSEDIICFDTIRKGLTKKDCDCNKDFYNMNLASFRNIGEKGIPYFSEGHGKEEILNKYFNSKEFKDYTQKEIRSIVINDLKMSYCPKSLLEGRN